MTKSKKVALLSAFGIAAILGVLAFVPPIPQDQAYHSFADQRLWLGVPNAGDVLSNIPFTLTGLWGLWLLYATPAGQTLAAGTYALPYGVFFAGVAAVGFGSAYYHWAPDNAALVWDRLPMTVGFMGLTCAVIADRVSTAVGKATLAPLIVLGIASVFYWVMTGDLRPYALVQFLPIAILPLLCWMLPPNGGLRGKHITLLFVLYALAKVFELADDVIWRAFGETVSGHSIKHLLAAGACLAVAMFVKNAGRAQ